MRQLAAEGESRETAGADLSEVLHALGPDGRHRGREQVRRVEEGRSFGEVHGLGDHAAREGGGLRERLVQVLADHFAHGCSHRGSTGGRGGAVKGKQGRQGRGKGEKLRAQRR